MKHKGEILELLDPSLGMEFNKEEATVMINVALLCTNVSPTLRPSMSSIVSMLEGKSAVHDVVSESSEISDEKKLEAMRNYYKQIEETDEITEIQKESTSKEGPSIASTSSAADLYPVSLESSYWWTRD